MSQRDELIAKYKDENKKLKLGIDEDLLVKVTIGLGPSIYKSDASRVSGSNEEELLTVKNNYLIKKLGLKDSPELMESIKAVIDKLGSSNPNKYRALIYAMLCEKFQKQSVYEK